MLKRLGVAVLVVSVLVVGLAGMALAQDATPSAAGVCPYGEACGGMAWVVISRFRLSRHPACARWKSAASVC